MAKKIKKTLFRLPYFGILLVVTVLALILLVDRKILPFVSNPILSIQAPVLQTEVVNFHPEVPGEIKKGSCFARAVSAPSGNGFRCSVGNDIYDPCIFAEGGKTLVCGVDPSQNTPGFVLDYIPPLPEPDADDKTLTKPWMIELASGRICSFAEGESGVIDGERINYYCESDEENIDVVVVGDLKEGKLWTGTRAALDNTKQTLTVTQEGIVPLKTVWIIE